MTRYFIYRNNEVSRLNWPYVVLQDQPYPTGFCLTVCLTLGGARRWVRRHARRVRRAERMEFIEASDG